jgi:hypothetical protein
MMSRQILARDCARNAASDHLAQVVVAPQPSTTGVKNILVEPCNKFLQ